MRELLVNRGANVNAKDKEQKTPLHLAVLGGYDEAVSMLCNHGASINTADENGQNALHIAACQGQLPLTQEILARGGNPSARLQVRSPGCLLEAWQGNTRAIGLVTPATCLLQDGSTAVHLAAWKGHEAVLAYLLHNGGDTNATTLDGQTPLHEAAAAGHEECCRLLLRHGASTSTLDADQRTPADVAHLSNQLRVAELLRPRPGEVEAQLRQQRVGCV